MTIICSLNEFIFIMHHIVGVNIELCVRTESLGQRLSSYPVQNLIFDHFQVKYSCYVVHISYSIIQIASKFTFIMVNKLTQ